ncbi:MAG: hypothetical protein RLN63_07330, partial [Miltoncostaeaceae bacterium]
MRFAKWQGLGNHYIVISREDLPSPLTPARARRLCDPHFGIGGDGILEVAADAGVPRMIVWNPDGSHAENCGNGIRMVGRYLDAAGRLPADGIILTGAGAARVLVRDDRVVEVAMGRARCPAGEPRVT